MSEIRTLSTSLMGRYSSFRYTVMQFTMPSVAPSGHSGIYRIKTTSFGSLVMVRSICDSEDVGIVFSSCPDINDIRRRIIAYNTDKQDYRIEWLNQDFGTFYQLSDSHMYVQVINRSSVETGDICFTLLLGI